ncbi:MAG TPA: chemotaxis protein CheW, partial [Geobacteraceae bacterium]|nr:chemotaxis protein CheW [Geobacteraceae bacterium]
AAVHSGDSVVSTIDDDGAGLDREAIRAAAVKKGLIAPSAELADKDIFALIFVPGFSTARMVSSVSGRGVGMDVVKRSIDSLRGTVEISSRPGKGTTIVVRIPLTLAIVGSLLVGIGRDRFVLPLALVEECVELTRADVAKTHGRNMADVRGRIVPYISLREVFGMRDATPEIQLIIITNLNGERVGFVVDYVVGEHQTVIKSLGRVYRDVTGISGATILGDGSVALILDPPHLARGAELKGVTTAVQEQKGGQR